MYSNRSFQRRQRQEASRSRKQESFSNSLIRLNGQSFFDTTGNNTTSRNANFDVVIVIMEGRGSSEGRIGIALHDVRYPDVHLCEFVDSREYTTLKTLINVHDAFDIVIQTGNEERGATKLLGEALMTAFPDASLQSISTKYFNSDRGERQLRSLMNTEISKISEGCFQRHLALGAASVLFKYIHETRCVFFRTKSLRVLEVAVDDTCMIDFMSWESLEIVDTDSGNKAKKSQMNQRRTLLSVLNHTVTTNGYRLLRSNVLQPSTNLSVITVRQEAIEELIDKPQLMDKLRKSLARAHELDRVIAMCIQTTTSWTVRESEGKINQIIRLLQTLKVIQAIRGLLDTAQVKSEILNEKTEFLKDERFDQIMSILLEKVDDSLLDGRKNSLHLQNTRCYAIKRGVAVQLDLARQTYEELIKNVEECGARELAEGFQNNPSCRLSFSQTRGFHYTMVTRDASFIAIPPHFLEVVRNRTTVTFNSRQIIAYNDRLEQVVAEMFLASDVIVCDMIEAMQPMIPVLYYAMDALSTIDFLCSLATYSDLRDTCRPDFGEAFSISQGRHPILDWANSEKTVTNDTCLYRDRRFGIITGPNMAGKSTYLKQVALLSIMTQIGCFIPADHATIPIFTRLFSRMGHNDDLSRNMSAFALEMTDSATILKYSDEKSLIVLDELARSTSTEEGIAITYAICEKILELKSYTFLATHFLDMAALANYSNAVENYHFLPQTDENSFKRHKLLRGQYRGPLYGFELVELSTFPDDVIENARDLAMQLRSRMESGQRDYDAERRRLKAFMGNRIKEYATHFREVYGNNWKEENVAIEKITSLRNHAIKELAKIDSDEQQELESN